MRVLLVLLGFLAACRELPPPVMAPPPPRLAVMTYNVNWGCPRPDEVVTAIRARDPDVVCLQETHRRWESLMTADLGARYPHRHFVHGRGAGGLGLLSRHPIVATRTIPRAEEGWFPALLAELATPIGLVRVLAVHLKPPLSQNGSASLSAYCDADRVHAAELAHFLEEAGEGPPLIVLGDFNEEEDDDGFAPLHARGMVDALSLYDQSSVTWSWPLPLGMSLSGRYDHLVFDAAHLRCTGAVVDRVGASDHEPVTAVFVRAP